MFDLLAKNEVVKADKPVEPVLQALVHPEFVEKALARRK
jgi:hypothetical protein